MSGFNMPPGVAPGDIPGNGPENEYAEKMESALALRFYCDDLNRELTVREYLHALLDRLWDEVEGFNGKRPFGNSSWQYDVFDALVRGGFLVGKPEDDRYYPSNTKDADALVRQLIHYALLGE
jgi:hypothetical protein